MRIQRGGRGSGLPLKNNKNIGFSSNTGPDPLKIRSYQAGLHRWRADDGPLIVDLGSSLPSSTKKIVGKVGPPLTKLSGSAHEKE